ncbi:MAG: hypothetical protein LBM60_07015 [Clostridium sp.]|nr:hypothetical protein [Clostridium sp.]
MIIVYKFTWIPYVLLSIGLISLYAYIDELLTGSGDVVMLLVSVLLIIIGIAMYKFCYKRYKNFGVLAPHYAIGFGLFFIIMFIFHLLTDELSSNEILAKIIEILISAGVVAFGIGWLKKRKKSR